MQMKLKKKPKQGEMMQDKEYHKEYKMHLKVKQKLGEEMQDKEYHNETEGVTEPIIFYLYFIKF